MNKELFTKKIIELRKKHHYTQQEVADKLNVSNKTVSRWETGESYPDIETLQMLASLYHVTTDYLLNDHENFMDIQKTDITKFTPWAIGILAVLIFYICEAIDVPVFLSFACFYFIIKFSYYFFNQYTDKSNYNQFVLMNTVISFFVFHNFLKKIIMFFYICDITSSMDMLLTDGMQEVSLNFHALLICSVLGYLCAMIYAYVHYISHIHKND